MESTNNEMIPYPEDNDTGNGALDLQLLAERVDALAGAQQVELRRIINKPGRVIRLTNNFATTAGIVNDVFAAGIWADVFSSAYPSPIVTPGFGGFTNGGLGSTPGIYRVGMYLNVSITGALTANSLRQLTITAAVPSDATIFPGTISTKLARTVNFDPQGALGLTAELEVYTPYPSNPVSSFGGTVFTATFLHANAASTVQVNAGSIGWIYRVADVELV